MDTVPYIVFFVYFFIFLVMSSMLEKRPSMYDVIAAVTPFFFVGLFLELKSCPEILLIYPYAYTLLLMSKAAFKHKVSTPNIMIL